MSGGDVMSTDDIAGVKVQRVKVQHGADGSATDVSAASPMPVNQTAALPAGTNNIGDVDIASAIPAGTNNIGDVDVLTMPVNDRLTDNVGAALQTDVIMNDTTALTPKFAAIAASTSGNNTIVAAVNPKKIRVLAVSLIASAAVNAKFQTGAGGTDLTGLYYCAANGGFVLPFNPVGWFETASNTLLNLNLSGATAVGGCITYVEV
jgi:hypothetical protein